MEVFEDEDMLEVFEDEDMMEVFQDKDMMEVDLEGGDPGQDAEPCQNYDGPWQHRPCCSITGISFYPLQGFSGTSFKVKLPLKF